MSSTFLKFALCTLIVTSLSPGQEAHASDTKSYNATACQPYSTTTLPSELSFRAHGLKNISANAEYVVCDVLLDNEDASFWSQANGGVTVTIHAATAGTARCELYIGSNLMGTVDSFIREGTLTAGQVATLDFANISTQTTSSGITPPASLFCRMPPQSSILQVQTFEQTRTD